MKCFKEIEINVDSVIKFCVWNVQKMRHKSIQSWNCVCEMLEKAENKGYNI